jgi:hypothetical protein
MGINKFNKCWKFIVILVLVLLINLPIISALELSNVRVDNVAETSAVVKWDTDEASDSFVSYGTEKENLNTIGDASSVTDHQFTLTDLSPETIHYYSVESNEIVDDNSGNLYSFTTLAPDTTAPGLVVEIPEMVPGNKLNFIGWTEPGTKVLVYVNGNQAGSTMAVIEEVVETENVDEVVETDELTETEVEEETVEEEEISESTEVEEINVTENETEETLETIEVEPVENNLTEEINDSEDNLVGETIATGSAAETEKTEIKDSTPKPKGKFEFSNIILQNNELNMIKVEAIDQAGNPTTWEGTVFADTSKPKLELEDLPDIVDKNSFDLKGKLSENSTFEVFVNNDSVFTGDGDKIEESITLEEGDNNIEIIITDSAGWKVTKKFAIYSDTQPPPVKIEIEKGKDYYQGRAVSTIHGETEPGATVYLYVHKPLPYEYTVKFDKAWEKVTADENGEFIFKDVNFEKKPINLKDLAPKQVPPGLQEDVIFPIEQLAEQEEVIYKIYVLAEDRGGRTSYAQESINLKTCYSANWAFDVLSMKQFQAPLRLDPGLVDEGREIVQAVFNFSYRGQGVAQRDLATGNILPGKEAYVINSVKFDKACTEGLLDDKSFKLGCAILPQTPRGATPNADKTAWLVNFNLHSAEKVSETDEDFWNEFKKRQVMFPLKILVRYQERDSNGKLGMPKTQTQCYDLSYFVDIPIDSKDMLPDWLTDEGIDAIEWTLDKIDLILPYLEKAIMVTGVVCIASFLGRMVIRWLRIFYSRWEAYTSSLTKMGGGGGDDSGGEGKSEDGCPTNQNQLLLESTKKHWEKVEGKLFEKEVNKPRIKDWKEQKTLDDRCPKTAAMWKTENYLDTAYRWSCDRVFCRAVPAGWTSEKDKTDIDSVILSQKQCTATSKGIPLQPIKNCQTLIAQSVTGGAQTSAKALDLKKGGAFPCYKNPLNDQLYHVSEPAKGVVDEPKILKLKWLGRHGMSLQEGLNIEGDDLIAYKPAGSKDIMVGTDQSCNYVCSKMGGYKADQEGGIESVNMVTKQKGKFGCYKEVLDELSGETRLANDAGYLKGADKIPAAYYTQDCFVNVDENGKIPDQTQTDVRAELGMLQCVCTPKEGDAEKTFGSRTAAKKIKNQAEDWVYRQEEIFKDSHGTQGTFYPTWRYYKGRDVSSAFGADYLTDYFRGNKTVHEINPSTQHIGAFQTVCLSGIRARLMTLKSILEGLRNCIEEAKITGLHDAGVCKTLFTQHVCGLIYKAIAYFFTDCSPYSVKDESNKGTFGQVGKFFEIGLGSIGDAMQTSIDDVQADYGNSALNQYFATGVKGFSESICMAAFGYDFPLGIDFIQDAAYAFPTKTTVHVIPAERELSTYNPATGQAIYNYNIGAMALPGCNIANYKVYLKCVGQEDYGHPGVQCGTQKCDCLQTTDASGTELRTFPLDGGQGFDLSSGSFVSFPIPAPQKVDSPYRYDHVVAELQLGPYEDASKCFDEGYRDGKFYFPIIDISPKSQFNCDVQPVTGKYTCPEVAGMFSAAGSGAYLQDPFITCYDKNTQTYASCKTPNLFTKEDEIKVKLHLATDGGQYCLRTTVTGLQPEHGIPSIPKPIPQGLATTHTPVINLGTVNENMFSGAANTLMLSDSESDPGCSNLVQLDYVPQSGVQSGSYRFSYSVQNGLYRIIMQQGIVPDSPYLPGQGNILKDQANNEWISGDKLKEVKFNIGGFKVHNLIGSPLGDKKVCVYHVGQATGGGYAQGEKSVQVNAEILQADQNGGCYNVDHQVVAPAFGLASYQESILIRLNPLINLVANKMHEEFIRNNHGYVIAEADAIINRKQADMEDVVALYYRVASQILQAGNEWKSQSKVICNYLKIFLDREYPGLGENAPKYSEDIQKKGEYKKVDHYFREIAKEASCTNINVLGGGTTEPQTPGQDESSPAVAQT